jgi:hypothetical protein
MDHFVMIRIVYHAPGDQIIPMGTLALIIRQTLKEIGVIEIRQLCFVAHPHVTPLVQPPYGHF